MTAAVLQGAPATTLDTDLWIDLPERSYVRVLGVAERLGATVLARTVVALSDDSLVNFLYRVDGLASFATEARRAKRIEWLGQRVLVLPLERLIRSKEVVGRPKDLAHLPLLRQTLALTSPPVRRGAARRRGGGGGTPGKAPRPRGRGGSAGR